MSSCEVGGIWSGWRIRMQLVPHMNVSPPPFGE